MSYWLWCGVERDLCLEKGSIQKYFKPSLPDPYHVSCCQEGQHLTESVWVVLGPGHPSSKVTFAAGIHNRNTEAEEWDLTWGVMGLEIDLLQIVLWALTAAAGGVAGNFMGLKIACWTGHSVSWRAAETKGNSEALLCVISKGGLQVELSREMCCGVLRKILWCSSICFCC